MYNIYVQNKRLQDINLKLKEEKEMAQRLLRHKSIYLYSIF